METTLSGSTMDTMVNPYLPIPMTISNIITETTARDLKSFQLEFRNESDADKFSYTCGQFAEICVFGAGESPIGIASLIGEGIYQLGKAGVAERKRIENMSPKERELFDAQQESISEFAAAGGGIAKLAGKSSGPPPEAGPTPQGLDFLMKRGR